MSEILFKCFPFPVRLGPYLIWYDNDKLVAQAGRVSNRLFYLSIPPNIFIDAVKCASLSASSANGWTRVIVEKPFGRDSESSAALTNSLKQYLAEDQIFRWIFFNWVLFVLIGPFLLIGCFDRTNMC